MARPTRCRRICMEPAYDSFFPDGFLTGEEVIMTLDEYETIRLIDLEEYTQHECAKQMNILGQPQQRFIKAQDTRWQTAL